MDLDEEENDFESYDRSEGKPIHVDLDEGMTEGNQLTLALLPNRSEEDKISNDGKTRDRDGNIYLGRSSRIFKPPELYF